MPHNLHEFHNPAFDPHVVEAHSFTADNLGLNIADMQKVTIIDQSRESELRNKYELGKTQQGGFNPKTGEVLLIAQPDTDNPDGATVRLGAQAVHELTHSGTANLYEHSYFNEAIAGMGEAKYLQWLQEQGRWKPASDYIMEKAGVRIWLPGSFRYYDVPEYTGVANTSQGLVASMGVGMGMHHDGTKVADIMRISKLGGTDQFTAMKRSIDSLQDGLSKEVESYPMSTEGIIQATAAIQDVARKRGIIK